MKFIRINFSILLVLLICFSWPADADDSSSKGTNRSAVSKNPRIVPVANRVFADEPPIALPTPEPVAIPETNMNSQSPATRTWTLKQLESIANASHPMLQRDISKIDSARGDELQAGLYPNPHFDTNNPQVFSGQNSLFNYGFQQEFVVGGKKRLDRAAATKIVQQNEFAYVYDRFSLMTALRKQFYVVLAAESRVKTLRKLQEVTGSSVESGRKLAKIAGEVSPMDVYVLQIDSQQVEADLENAIRLLRGARKQLALIVSDQSISEDEFEGNIFARPPQYDEKTLNEFVTINSAPIEMQKLEIERNEILLQRAIVEPYPNVTLGPAMQYGLVNGSEQYWMTVTFPIPSWDRNQGNIQSQRADLAASRQNLMALQLDLLGRVANAYANHRAVRIQAVKYKKEILPNVQKTLSLARIGYKEGEYDFPRYLQVQRTYVDTVMKYIGLLEDVWTTAADLSGLLQLEEFE